jgi:hypothetical protein
MPSNPELVFISYSHRDRRWLDRLIVHLKPLERAGMIVPWEDTRIRAGERWRDEIVNSMAAARVAVLLVSAEFLASDFIAKNELPPLLESARAKGLIVIPVIVSPCRYEQTPALASLQSINPPSKALSQLRKADSEEYFVKLSIQIEGALSVGKTSPAQTASVIVPRFPFPNGGSVRSLAGTLKEAKSDEVGAEVPIFAEQGNQWALIIGTEPHLLIPPGPIPTEIIDAGDVLDWFLSVDVYGSIPPERLFFLAGEHATLENVSWAFREISGAIQATDSILVYYSGHSAEFSDPGELVLYDAPRLDRTRRKAAEDPRGLLRASSLVDWCNRLSARKVVCILDSGGPACYKASGSLHAGRYLISALEGRYIGRNGIFTWYVCRIVQKFGRGTTVAQLHDVLRQADALLDTPLSVYLRGRD